MADQLNHTQEVVYCEADLKEAEQTKNLGNMMFKECKYIEACNMFTKAIKLCSTNPIYFLNRSLCHIKLENHGEALKDAERCIELKPSNVKAYYRKGTALMGMGKFKEAADFYHAVWKKKPKNLDVKQKYEECSRIHRSQAFARAIAFDNNKSIFDEIDISSLSLGIPDSYTGPKIAEDGIITEQFVKHLSEYQRDRKLLHKSYVIQVLAMVKKALKDLPNVVRCSFTPEQNFTVCGDVHGQYYDLINIFEINGKPAENNRYLFNGDFVDRGSFSVEVILLLFSYKVLYPDYFFLNRGNHETIGMNQVYGFEAEVKEKYSNQVFQMFTEVFNLLPLVHLLNDRVFVVHGGLPVADGVTLKDINKIFRARQPPNEGLMSDLLWADPQNESGRSPSPRGVGKCFGPDITQEFCKLNSIDYIIRSHEVKEKGYEQQHNNQCITIFSAPNYTDQRGNLGAFINFDSDMQPKFKTFPAVPHPDVKPMAYTNPMLSNF